MDNAIFHKPVMVDEIIELLQLERAHAILDATVGCGGHANYILEKTKSRNAFLIGIDRDENSLKIAREQLQVFGERQKLVHANFRDLDKVLRDLRIDNIDRALFDLGISSYQLSDAGRGFSFMKEGALDMRMDPSIGPSAYEIVNKCNRTELEDIIREFGQERYYRRITGFILERRRRSPISSTKELSEVIRSAVGAKYRSQRIHPATRTFQALRISVNSELDNIDCALEKIINILKPGGRICVISFHSLEDRIVKVKFKEFKRSGKGHILTKKPLIPTGGEIRENARSRSAKLRAFEKQG